VKLFQSDESNDWFNSYPIKIKQKEFAMYLEILKEFEEDLAHFCYSIYTLKPSCDSYIFRKSNSSLPSIQSAFSYVMPLSSL
jgi:hypothetical protein